MSKKEELISRLTKLNMFSVVSMHSGKGRVVIQIDEDGRIMSQGKEKELFYSLLDDSFKSMGIMVVRCFTGNMLFMNETTSRISRVFGLVLTEGNYHCSPIEKIKAAFRVDVHTGKPIELEEGTLFSTLDELEKSL